MKKKFSILIILLSFSLASFRTDDMSPSGKILTDGFIDITVESNISRVFFSCSLAGISIHVTEDPGNEPIESLNITVPVNDFRSTSEAASHDFLTLLKADQYPTLSIKIPQQNLAKYAKEEYITIYNLVLNIAGVTKKYDIRCRAEKLDSGNSFLVGTLKVRLTDLNIKPPVKYFGLVKIKDEVIVKFGFSYEDYNLTISNNSG